MNPAPVLLQGGRPSADRPSLREVRLVGNPERRYIHLNSPSPDLVASRSRETRRPTAGASLHP